ncbi:MAG: shikimate dehydrogenase [Flavobacteriales bacterium]|nr:shikimate dehydrogenase [Flavobacteriales bacterium]
MKTYGLIGFPLTHSFSKSYFEKKFESMGLKDHQYQNFPIANIAEIEELVAGRNDLLGLNVTIPYKESVIPFLDELEPEAEKIGAVNTIRILHKGEKVFTTGYNTDVYGFAMSLKPFLLNTHHRALILGTGGASKAVAYVLKKIGISYVFVSRSEGKGKITWKELNADVIKAHPLIINTTPVGTFPNVNDCPPLPTEGIGQQHLIFDLIYNPEETLLLKKARENGAVVLNGLTMLKLQAEKSWEIWNL